MELGKVFLINKVFKINKEHSKDEFIRKVLIELAASIETPIDVVKASFEDVEESVREVLVCSAHVETHYSASIGYDRTEEYWDSNQNKEKTRTVTDWKPFSGNMFENVTEAVFNDNEKEKYEIKNLMRNAISLALDESVVEIEENVDIKPSSLSLVKKECAWAVEHKVSFPGDRQKNKKFNSNVDIQEIKCYKIPFYKVTFTYGGEKYTACGFACGDVDVYTEYPRNEVDIIKKLAKDETKGGVFATALAWMAFIALYVFSILYIIDFGHDVDIAICFCAFETIILIALIVIHVLSNKAYNKKVKLLQENNITLKKKELDSVLLKYGYDSTTTDENLLFDSKQRGSSYASKHKRKGAIVTAIFGTILTIILFVVLIKYLGIIPRRDYHNSAEENLEIRNIDYEVGRDVHDSPVATISFDIFSSSNRTIDFVRIEISGYYTYINGDTEHSLGSFYCNFSGLYLSYNYSDVYSVTLNPEHPNEGSSNIDSYGTFSVIDLLDESLLPDVYIWFKGEATSFY